jgi:hypothetical protein
MEMDGAAIGSALAWLIGFVLLVALLLRGVRPRRLIPANARADAGGLLASGEIRKPLVPPPNALFRIIRPGLRLWMPRITPTVLRVSAPTLGEEMLYSAGFITFVAMVGHLGTDVLAAHGAVVRLEAFSFTAGWGIAVATAAMVGQALGARNLPLARRFFSLNTTVVMVVMGLVAYAFVFFPSILPGTVQAQRHGALHRRDADDDPGDAAIDDGRDDGHVRRPARCGLHDRATVHAVRRDAADAPRPRVLARLAHGSGHRGDLLGHQRRLGRADDGAAAVFVRSGRWEKVKV